MGVGKYNTTYFPVPSDYGVSAGPAPTSFNYNGNIPIPTGVSSNPFDQSAINWMYAQKYGKERVGQNQNLYDDYQLKLNNWAANGGRGVMPTAPAYYETDPSKLYSYFNSGEQGILTTNGVTPYNYNVDPLQQMYQAGSPNNPLYQSGSYVYGAGGYNPAYAQAQMPQGRSLQQQFAGNWSPQAYAGASPNGGPPPNGLNNFNPGGFSANAFATVSPDGVPTGMDPGSITGPRPGVAPTSFPTGGGGPNGGLPQYNGGLPNVPYGQNSPYGPYAGGYGSSQYSYNSALSPINVPSIPNPQGLPQLPAYQPSGNDQFLSGLGDYFKQFANFAQTPQQANLNTPDIEWLRNYIKQGGNPIDQTYGWNAMNEAQQRNIQRKADDLSEYFNVMGGRYSTAFGNAMTDYYSQTAKDQNAMLAAAQTQALENAAGRTANAGQLLSGFDIQSQTDALQRQAQLMSQLGQMGYSGPALQSQLENQRFLQGQQLGQQGNLQTQNLISQKDFLQAQLQAQANLQAQGLGSQQYMQSQQLQNLLEQQGRNFGFNAAMYNAQASDAASNALLNNAVNASGSLLNNSTLAAQLLYGNQNAAAGTLFGNQGQGLTNFANNYLAQQGINLQGQGLNLNTAAQVAQLANAGINLGGMLGGQQAGTLQQQIDKAYQEWIRTQPQYNPLLQMLMGSSSQQAGLYFPQFQPSFFQSTLLPLIQAGMGMFKFGMP